MSNKHTHTVSLRSGEVVTLRELTWRESMEAARRVSSSLLGIVDTKTGTISLDETKIADAFVSNEALVDWLFGLTTGKDNEWISALGASDALNILDKICELHLSADLLHGAKSIGSRVFASLGLQAAAKN